MEPHTFPYSSHWNLRVPKVDLNSLSEEDKAVVEWLREQDLIDCSALLENEDNPAGHRTLLGNMPPKSQTTKTMDEVAMLKALRAREKKNKAAEKVNINSTEHLGTGAAQGATTDVGSIFYRCFPIEQIVEKNLNRKEDRARVHKAGMRNLGKKLQSFEAQMAFFRLCVDQYVGSEEKEMKNALLKNKDLAEKLKNAEGDIKTVERLKTDLVASEKKNNELTAEKATWDEKYSNMKKAYEDAEAGRKTLEKANKTLEMTVATLTTENKGLISEKDLIVAELGDAKVEVAMQHVAGFEKAVSRLKFPYPNLKVDEVGAFKHIVDGKLVDIVIDEDEE
ncbi:hypothetical protein SESBI_01157 [Sesbania bispinosa]|nr:hypothetical protein SESBI_01157 [Sesbania bispinosa]